MVTFDNEVKTPGDYEENFSTIWVSASGGDASALSSGVYIYTLQVDGYSDIKKILLMK